MSKKLNVESITSDLEGSAFFRDAHRQARPTAPAVEPEVVAELERSPTRIAEAPSQLPRRASSNNSAHSQDSKSDSYKDIKITSYQDINPTLVRRVVKDSGKEASILRVSPEEKEQLAEVLYQCKRRGLKTTETQIVRIAVAALLQEYDANQDKSILARVLQALKE